VGGLVTIAPIAVAELLVDHNLSRVQELCLKHLFLTHPDSKLAEICSAYVALIAALLFRPGEDALVSERSGDQLSKNNRAADIINAIAKKSVNLDLQKLSEKAFGDNEVVGGKFSKACYIEDSWCSLLYLAYKYVRRPDQALFANTNLGGENCHRGSVLGVITGLATADGVDNLFSQLVHATEISSEINALISLS
jgi:hypothetical protein